MGTNCSATLPEPKSISRAQAKQAAEVRMTAPVTSSSSQAASAQRVPAFPPRRQDQTISNAQNPTNLAKPFLPSPLQENVYL